MKNFRTLSFLVIIFALVLLLTVPIKGAGNWWNKFGTPEYGGTYTMRTEFIDIITEPQDPRSSQFASWYEVLFADDWTVDRSKYSFQASFTPVQYRQGWLAEGYEMTNPTTVTVKIRKGIHWHDKAPTNGREFTAEDVQYSYDRILGTGAFAGQKGNPFYISLIPSVKQVVATDKYTVQFKLKSASAMAIYDVVEPFLALCMVPPEWVKLDEKAQKDWRNATGTGAFIPTDLVPNVSLTAKKNPNYWGYDERFPKNKLPYFDEIRAVVIPDMATAIAALRTAKVDIISDDMTSPTIANAKALAKSNPEIVQFKQPGQGTTFYLRSDIKPFNDIRVRKAMQMAINIPGIAKSYFQGYALGEPTGLLSPDIGADWSTLYAKWPRDLRAEYSYNPKQAKKLLAEAGYPKGFEVSLLACTSDEKNVIQILKDMFKDIGVTMNVNMMEKQQRDQLLRGGTYKDEMSGGGWVGPGGLNPPGTALGAYWSKKAERPGGALGVKDPAYDEYVDKFLAATTMDKAQSIFKEADMYSLGQHWTVQTGPSYSIKVCQPWLKGYSGETFWSANGWFHRTRMWIDSSMKKK